MIDYKFAVPELSEVAKHSYPELFVVPLRNHKSFQMSVIQMWWKSKMEHNEHFIEGKCEDM